MCSRTIGAIGASVSAIQLLRGAHAVRRAVARPAVALFAGVASAVFVAVAAAVTYAAEAADTSPIHLDGAWRVLFVLAIGGALATYLIGLHALSYRHVTTSAVIAIAVVTQLAPLAAPLLLSKDSYYYWATGRVGAVHGQNLYERAPADFPQDPAHRYVGADWVDTTPVYGPAFSVISEAHAAVAGNSPTTATRLYRVIAALAVVAIVGLSAAASARPSFAAAFVGWNPLLALHFGGGGHNDALMMVPVMAALVLGRRGRYRLAGAAWALAIGVKWVAAVPLPMLALAARKRVRRRLVEGFAAAAALLAALATVHYGPAWLNAFASGAGDAEWTSSLSLTYKLEQLGVPRRAAIGLLGLAFVAVYVRLALEASRGRPRLALPLGLLLLSTPWLVPWYALWIVPIAAVEDDRAARILAVALTAYLLRDAVPL